MTLEHKTRLKCQFCAIEMYASYENWINSFALMYGLEIFENLVQKNLNIEKLIFKVVQINF